MRSTRVTSSSEAKIQHAEWVAEVETRIATLRAQKNGEGQSLTKLNAIALAGRWYVLVDGHCPFSFPSSEAALTWLNEPVPCDPTTNEYEAEVECRFNSLGSEWVGAKLEGPS